MERQPVTKGRNIAAVGYDAEAQTLEIEFSSGGIYSYAAVPPDVHDKLIHAESPGSYFATFVRPCFECTHLNPKPKEENHAEVPNPSLAKDLKKATAKAAPQKKARRG